MGDPLVFWGLTALGATLLALTGASVGLGFEIRAATRARRAARAHVLRVISDHEVALRWDAIVEDLKDLDKKVHYRHNLHCGVCGRFAAKTDEPGVSVCRVHGTTARIELSTGTIPIIISSLSEDIEMTIDHIPVEIDALPEPDPVDVSDR